jgi:hypothetical protein
MIRVIALFGAAYLLSGIAHAENIQFNATMTGAAEVPAKLSNGKGTATATLDTATKALTYAVEYSDLSGPATAAHFHGPAEPTANAGVVVPFPAPASPIKGSTTLSDAQVADLMAGRWYANVHTAANPGGEIRGQMARGK